MFRRRYGGYRRSFSRYGRRPYYGVRSRARSFGYRRRGFTSTRRVRFGGRRY